MNDWAIRGIFAFVILFVLGLIGAAVFFGVEFESCEDYDTVRVGKTTTQVCDND
jgi:hypothetical protein